MIQFRLRVEPGTPPPTRLPGTCPISCGPTSPPSPPCCCPRCATGWPTTPLNLTAALGAVNTLLGFFSRGTIQLAGEDGQSGQSANPAGVLPLPVASMGEDVAPAVEDRSQYPDQDTSSIPNGSGSSSPLSGSTRLMIVLGALMILLGNSCSNDADPVATSVALTDGQVVVIRGGSSLVVDRTEHKLLWSQSAPEVVVAPVVQATSK